MQRIKHILVIFQDDNKWSLSRISAALVLLVNLVYAAWVVYATKALPDLQAGWLTLILALYGINKTAGVFSAVKKVAE